MKMNRLKFVFSLGTYLYQLKSLIQFSVSCCDHYKLIQKHLLIYRMRTIKVHYIYFYVYLGHPHN